MARHIITRAALGAAAVLAAVTIAAPEASASTAQGHSGAVFVQTDSTTGNAVVAYDRSSDGTLKQAAVYRTGGLGGVLDGSVVDHQASQGSLAYDQRHQVLIATNSGSNTVTVFAVRGTRLIRIQTISSGGRFPVSVAVHGDRVYVLNALDGGSLQGYWNLGGHLVPLPGQHRALGLDPTAAPQFTHTPAQVQFTPDGSHLVVATKAVGDSLMVYSVNTLLGLSAKPTVTSTGAGSVPFGFAFDRGGRVLLTEAGPNAVASVRLDKAGRATVSETVATGQAATCWITVVGDYAYAANAGSGTITTYSVGHGRLDLIGQTPASAGTIDLTASSDGKFLYAQAGKDGEVDAFRIGRDGGLTSVGTVVVPDAVGGEGIVAS
ncbi:beta-propeller fold lactonase family protein [Amycolatopsis rhabdoformis]|uniref:Beta-propeller fold lactonase family protein n=1 Tax=Amycolatopsis rhabdoformis TaxID=1448059 RepID=A0ABZ1IFB2_9PSEU|nr:beta-propeller fold lactonase family protein [Amycolatopsis rhabdoformis]WSE32441.1 beta-propeller fold lactonase family protein [Amycolatopsis rhabdoformis]